MKLIEVIKNFIAISQNGNIESEELNKRLLRIAELRAEPNNGLVEGYIPFYRVHGFKKANPKALFYYNFDIWRLNNSTVVLIEGEPIKSKLQISYLLIGIKGDEPLLTECQVNDIDSNGELLTESKFIDIEKERLSRINNELSLDDDTYLKFLIERQINLN